VFLCLYVNVCVHIFNIYSKFSVVVGVCMCLCVYASVCVFSSKMSLRYLLQCVAVCCSALQCVAVM